MKKTISNSTISDFFQSCFEGNLKKIQRFIRQGINVNLKDKNCYLFSALHHAVINQKINVVQYLIQNGCDVNILNRVMETPLHLASLNGLQSICQILVMNGAKIDIKNREGITPIDYAKTEEIKDFFKVFKVEKEKLEKEEERIQSVILRYNDVLINNSIKTMKLFLSQSKYLNNLITFELNSLNNQRKLKKDFQTSTVKIRAIIQDNNILKIIINFLEGKLVNIKNKSLFQVYKFAKKWNLNNLCFFIFKSIELKVNSAEEILNLLIQEEISNNNNNKKSTSIIEEKIKNNENENINSDDEDDEEEYNFQVNSEFQTCLFLKCQSKQIFSSILKKKKILKYPKLLRKLSFLPTIKLTPVSIPSEIYEINDVSFSRYFFFLHLYEMYQRKKFINYSLISSDDREFFIHKEVLMIKSEYFFKMLEPNYNFLESKKNNIKIFELNGFETNMLVEFLYTEQFNCEEILNISHLVNLLNLLIFSDKILYKKLEKYIGLEITKIFNNRNEDIRLYDIITPIVSCIEIIQVYHFLFEEKFNTIKKYIMNNFKENLGIKNFIGLINIIDTKNQLIEKFNERIEKDQEIKKGLKKEKEIKKSKESKKLKEKIKELEKKNSELKETIKIKDLKETMYRVKIENLSNN